MAVGNDHPAVAAYLARLDAVAASLPPARRLELVGEIRGHVADALAEAGRADDAAVSEVLDRLGDPEDIVAAERGDAAAVPASMTWPVPAASAWTPVEVIAVVLLTAGTFVIPVVGPLIGLVLVWASVRWTRREKSVATVLTLLPGVVLAVGLALFLFPVAGNGVGGSGPVEPVVSSVPAVTADSLSPGGTP